MNLLYIKNSIVLFIIWYAPQIFFWTLVDMYKSFLRPKDDLLSALLLTFFLLLHPPPLQDEKTSLHSGVAPPTLLVLFCVTTSILKKDKINIWEKVMYVY